MREMLFRYRSFTPLPFLLVMLVYAEPTIPSLASGAVLVILGESLRFWGVAYAGSLTRVTGSVGAPEVVVSGPFAYVRNPLYDGNLVVYVGIGIMSNALFPWLALASAIYFSFQYALIVSLEEEFLERQFGEAYSEFRRNVPRFIPGFRRYRSADQQSQKPNWREAVRSESRTLQAIGLVMILLVVLHFRS